MKILFRQSEESLWKAFLSGDPDAFEVLVKDIYSDLFHYGSKFSRDHDLIKDCIQDVFLRVWETRANLNEAIPPMPYLFASLRRRIHRQADQENNQAGFDWETDYFEVAFSVEDDLIQLEANKELSHRFATLLNHLPSRQKEIILLKFFENLSREEIASIMQISPQSVSNTLQKSLNWFRNNWSLLILLLLFYFL